MDLYNPWFLLAIVSTVGLFHLEMIADFLNLSRLPKQNGDKGSEERERLVEYNTASAKVDIFRNGLSLGLLIVFWSCGGFGWLDRWTHSFGWDATRTGVLLIVVLSIVQSLLALPFEAWDTFGIEARFGFNRTTVGTFFTDHIKGLILSAIIGLPVIWLIVWFFTTQELAALYAWLSVVGIGLVMSWLAPRLIMPLFLKFQPLQDGTLRNGILALAKRLAFPVGEVSIVDGSRRSTKANAFFAGFGKNKRIALFDTLLGAHTDDEIIAVLAHEIGHFKKRHVIRQMIVGFAQMAALFALLHFALRSPALFHAFGVSSPSAGMGLVLFMIVYRPLSTLLDVFQLSMSRRFEFEADAFAADAVGGASTLTSALDKLSHDQLAHPAPHPFYVWLHYSHPPLVERLRALAAHRVQPSTV